MAQFKVMTINMANYDDHGSWSNRVILLASVISDKQPDIILFQEVRFNPDQPDTKKTYQNMAEEVLALLQNKGFYRGAYHAYIPVERIPLPPGNLGFNVPSPAALSPLGQSIEWEALSIISKFWIKETGCCWLASPTTPINDLNTRATQYAAIDFSNGQGPTLYVFNIHFSTNVSDAINNANATIAYIKKIVNINQDYFLLAGDFNMEPGQAPITILNNTGYLTDMWNNFWPVSPGYTYPSTRPIKRIDYIFLSSKLLPKAASIYVTANRPDPGSGVYPSDHFGLLSTFNSLTPTLEDPLLDDFVIVNHPQNIPV